MQQNSGRVSTGSKAIPTKNEVAQYIIENGYYSLDIDKFYQWCSEHNWDQNGTMLDWKVQAEWQCHHGQRSLKSQLNS